MIVKIGVLDKKKDTTWYYWETSGPVKYSTGTLKIVHKNKDSVGQILVSRDSDGVSVQYTRTFFIDNIKEGTMVRIIEFCPKGQNDLEVLAVTYNNKIFLLNDEGKTIDRL